AGPPVGASTSWVALRPRGPAGTAAVRRSKADSRDGLRPRPASTATATATASSAARASSRRCDMAPQLVRRRAEFAIAALIAGNSAEHVAIEPRHELRERRAARRVQPGLAPVLGRRLGP